MKSNTIQIIVVGIFILFAVAGVIIFSMSRSENEVDNSNVEVLVWGVLPKDDLMPVIERANTETVGLVKIDYVEKTSAEIESDLITALLDQTGVPDGLLISHEDLIKFQKRLTLIAWTAVSERDLKDNYSQAGEVFFTPTGTYAIPFLIDPLVLYWNRDIFNSKAVTKPPAKWEELVALSPEFTERFENRTIKKNAIALGEYQNIPHAKAILSALSLQVGGKLIERTEDSFAPAIIKTQDKSIGMPLANALAFYTQFADPAGDLFSWSRALPDALSMFLSGDSAMYIGFGSEAGDIRAKNPNLNFDIALLPQANSENNIKKTYGNVYGFAIVNQSPYKEAMLRTALQLTGTDFQSAFATESNRAPVRRELLARPPGGSIEGVVWQSALWTEGLLDPDPAYTSLLFETMIESVTTGKSKVSDAVLTLSEQLKELFDGYRR